MADENKKKKRPTAEKRNIQNKKRRMENKIVVSRMRTTVKRFKETLEGGEVTLIQERLNDAYSVLDKSVKKGVIKKNAASRTKSRLAARAAAKA